VVSPDYSIIMLRSGTGRMLSFGCIYVYLTRANCMEDVALFHRCGDGNEKMLWLGKTDIEVAYKAEPEFLYF
jgi:hypothetical protein